MYSLIMDYLGKGLLGLERLRRKLRRQIIRKARKVSTFYPSKEKIPSLRYCEYNGALSLCVVQEEFEGSLLSAHEDHGQIMLQKNALAFWLAGLTGPQQV